ncbi:putative transcription factor bZIP family [Helianthus anomalus]
MKMILRGIAQLKKKPIKKQKASDEEDSSYELDEPKKQLKERKAVQAGVIPRRVRVKKSGAEPSKDKGGKKEKYLQQSKVHEAEKVQSVEIPKEPEVQNVEVPVVEVQKKTGGDDDYVEINGCKVATPPRPPPKDQLESSQPKDTTFDYIFEDIPTATGIYTEDIPEDDYDMFNNEAVKKLLKKVANLEKEKAKTEAERDILKKQVDQFMKAHDEIRMLLIDQEETMNKMKNDAHDNSKVFEFLTAEISTLNVKIKNLEDVNQTLNQLLSEMSEASSNEMKVIKLEMEAMKADKVMKDNQQSMLTAIIESHLKVDIHTAFNEVEIKRAEERRIERERLLAQEATERRKGVVENVVGSSSQPEAGGSSTQEDIEMINVENVQQQDVEAGQDFMLVGESSEHFDINDVLQRVNVIQRKRKAKEVLLLEWKTQQFMLVGKASSVPYSAKEIARQIKIKKRRRRAKIARGEIVDDDSDIELFGVEEKEEDDNDDDKKNDNDDNMKDEKDDKGDKGDDDNEQGASGLLIGNPNVQERIEELMNDEINEQEDDSQQEASSSGKQHADQVFVTNPTIIYMNAQQEGEIEVQRKGAEMLEELGLEDGKFKFDIEDEIPRSPEKNFEPRYAYEAYHYDEVIVEDASDSSDEETDFHYSGVDETFPSFAEMFKDRNEDEIRRKIVEKFSTEGVPETIPREILAKERRKWFKVMPKERKTLRALQYFTHNKDLSWGHILLLGSTIFEYLSDISTLPWWDVDELVKTKNIKQLYYGLEVKQHDQHLWNYIKWQEKNGYPDWKPQYPKQIVTILENGKKDITLDVKPPRCLKNMPLRAIKQDFHDLFQGWLYNETIAEAVISLYDKTIGKSRRISLLDPTWLVNCSKKDIDCLFYNKIVYEKRDKVQALQYQSIVDVCFAQDINSRRYWKTKWRDLETNEFLKEYTRNKKFEEIAKRAAELGKRKLGKSIPTDQTPIESEENKIPKWDRKRDGDPVYRKWWIDEGRYIRKRMLEEKAEKRRQKAKERRRNRKN